MCSSGFPLLLFGDHHRGRRSVSGGITLSDLGHYREICPYCEIDCFVAAEGPDEAGEFLAVCERCGWWSWLGSCQDARRLQIDSAEAVLTEFKSDDFSVTVLEELARYLAQNESKILGMPPSQFEGLVGAIFREALGYRIEFCSYGRPDRGIDLVCGHLASDEKIAIQVKRTSRPIRVGLIREFCGAMIDPENRYRRGVFVTTSSFQSGCPKFCERLRKQEDIKIDIDLVDGRRFLEYLGLLNTSNTPRIYCPVWGTVTADEAYFGVFPDQEDWLDLGRLPGFSNHDAPVVSLANFGIFEPRLRPSRTQNAEKDRTRERRTRPKWSLKSRTTSAMYERFRGFSEL
jgi:hypothetical protein